MEDPPGSTKKTNVSVLDHAVMLNYCYPFVVLKVVCPRIEAAAGASAR